MKRGLAFLIAGSVLVTAFAGALDVLIRYNLNWIDFIKYSFALTKEEQDYLNDTDLVCGVKYNDLPLSFVNEEDENDGILIDFLSQLSIEVENAISVKLERTEALARGLQQKQFQAVIAERGDLPGRRLLFYGTPLHHARKDAGQRRIFISEYQGYQRCAHCRGTDRGGFC